jgi:hypothetical protein
LFARYYSIPANIDMASAPDSVPLVTDAEFAGDTGAYPRQRRGQDPLPDGAGMVSANRYQDNRLRKYNGPLSVNLGIIEIFLQTLAIVLNGVGVGLQGSREHWISNVVFMVFPSVWTGVFVSRQVKKMLQGSI